MCVTVQNGQTMCRLVILCRGGEELQQKEFVRKMGDKEKTKTNVFIGLKGMPSVWPTVRPFVGAGTSCLFALPIELIKVRVQLGQGSTGQITLNILKNEGIATFHKGFSAGLLRGVSHILTKAELYKISTSKATGINDRKRLPVYQLALYQLIANAAEVFVSNPADLALIRMQADKTLPAAQQRNYTNVFHAFYRILADEGVLSLWRGSGPTIVRSFAMDASFFVTCQPTAVIFRRYLGFDPGPSLLGNKKMDNLSKSSFCLIAILR